MRPRAALWLPGPENAARIEIDEQDLPGPWTAEFWLCRAPILDAAVAMTRRALGLRLVYGGLQLNANETRRRVKQLDKQLARAAQIVSQSRGADAAAVAEKERITDLILAANEAFESLALQVRHMPACTSLLLQKCIYIPTPHHLTFHLALPVTRRPWFGELTATPSLRHPDAFERSTKTRLATGLRRTHPRGPRAGVQLVVEQEQRRPYRRSS